MNKKLLIKIFQEIILWGTASVAAIYLLFNLFPPLSAATIVGDGVLVYATTTNATIQYRTYASSTNAFSNPASNANAATVTIHHIVLEGSPTSTEKIMAIADDQGVNANNAAELTVQRWNGASWTTDWTSALATSSRRAVDLAYYGNSGSAIIVYASSTAGALNYRTWNGSTWSATSTITLATGAAQPVWVEVEGFAIATSSQRIVMGYQDTSNQVGAAIWNGSSWSAATTTGTNITTNSNATRIFDVALETISGDALWAFGFRNAPGIQSATCVSGCSSWTTVATIMATDDADFVDMASAPFLSDTITLVGSCAINLTNDDVLQAATWNGAAWPAGDLNAQLDIATICDTAGTEGTFPAATGWYTTGPTAVTGTPILLYNDAATAGSIFKKHKVNSTGVWTTSNITSVDTGCAPGAFRSNKITSWPTQPSVMIGSIGNTGVMCQIVSSAANNTTFSDPTPNGAEGFVQAPLSGFAASFAFNNVVSSTFGQRDFRWYVNDANSANPSDPWPTGGTDLAENASITSSDSPPATNDIVRLRISATSTAATIPVGTSLKVQFQATASTDCTTGSWTDVGAATTWALVNNAGVTDGTTIARSLVASTINENYNESNPSLGIPNFIGIGSIGELDWPILNNGAAGGTTYTFRLAQSDGTAFSAYTNCPQITTASAAGPTTDQVLRHGAWFNAGVEQEFFWAK